MKIFASVIAVAFCLAASFFGVSPAVAEYLFYRNSSVLADHQQFGVPVNRLDRDDLAHERARQAEHTQVRARLGDPDRVCQSVVVNGRGEIRMVVIICGLNGRPR
jgi:hypothetical protein